MRDFKRQTFERFFFDGVTVILRGDYDFARFEILDGVVGAAVPEFELVRVRAQRQRKNLMSQADAENRSRADKFFDFADDFGHVFGVAGAVGQKNTVGFERKNFFGGRLRGHDGHAAVEFAQAVQNIFLDAEIHRHDIEGVFAGVKRVSDGRGHHLDDVLANRQRHHFVNCCL